MYLVVCVLTRITLQYNRGNSFCICVIRYRFQIYAINKITDSYAIYDFSNKKAQMS